MKMPVTKKHSPKTVGEARELPIRLSNSWDEHVDRTRQAIKELDRKTVRSMADAHFIAVTNAR